MVAITANEYAKMRKIDPGAVRKAIKMGHNMPGILAKNKFGKSHQLWVSDEWYKSNKKYLKKVV